ncbi:hypothetical protein C6A85_02200, partial [Mycobacterium sp. ITM-2017-0098]
PAAPRCCATTWTEALAKCRPRITQGGSPRFVDHGTNTSAGPRDPGDRPDPRRAGQTAPILGAGEHRSSR